MSASEKIIVVVSEEFKDAIGKWATKNNKSMMEVAREAIAAKIGYNLAADTKSPRSNQKYANAEERYQANLKRQREDRQLAKKLIAAHREEQRQAAIKALEGKAGK